MLLTNATKPYGCTKPGWPCFLDDDETRCGHWVIEWIETHCVATQGHWVQQPAVLLQWEKDWLIELFGIDPEIGVRRYRWALLGTPKKSGKTELCAWLGNYGLIGDGEPSPWIAVAAAAEHQADLVYGAAKKCAEWSPTLGDVVSPHATEILVSSVPGAKLQRLSAKARTNDGPSWHMLLLDELHTWEGKQGRDLWTVLTNGIGARRQPLVLQITTAGVDIEESVCGEQYQLGLKLVEDPSLDPRYLFWWYQADPDKDWQDPETWKDANPSWGYTLPDAEAYLRDQLTKKRESEFKRYFLNLWVLSEDIWLPDGAWADCEWDPKEEAADFEFDTDRPLYVGIDGSLKKDAFAVTAAQHQNGRFVVQTKVWQNPYPSDHELHGSWKLNLEEPMNLCRKLYEMFPEPAIWDDTNAYLGPAFAYDPHFIEYAAQVLEGEGLNMVETPQSDQRMCPASEKLYELIMTKKLAHDGDPTLRRHVHAAVAMEKPRGWRLTRPKGSKRHIDALIALIMAVSVAFRPDQQDHDEPMEGPGLWL